MSFVVAADSEFISLRVIGLEQRVLIKWHSDSAKQFSSKASRSELSGFVFNFISLSGLRGSRLSVGKNQNQNQNHRQVGVIQNALRQN